MPGSMPPALSALASALLAPPGPQARTRPRGPPAHAAAANAPVAAALSLFLVSYRPPLHLAQNGQRRRRRRRRRRTAASDSSDDSDYDRDTRTGASASASASVSVSASASASGPASPVSAPALLAGGSTGGSAKALMPDLAEVSDLRSGGKRDIVVVTTAALPWMTGTAVNPLLRVMYLAADGHHVTLCVPWLADVAEQRDIFPSGLVFRDREQQTAAIFAWARAELPDVPDFDVIYYEGVYSDQFGSILPLDDPTAVLKDAPGVLHDVVVLEEPEHLTWHHTGTPWTRLFRFSVGVIHTNYLAYITHYGNFGPQAALLMSMLNSWCARAYCHRVIKLSDALQDFPHSVTCNVHGVREKFLTIGRARAAAARAAGGVRPPFEHGAYFLGKCLWSKGYRELIELMQDHYARSVAAAGETGAPPGADAALPIDFFGSGPDNEAVSAAVRTSPALANVNFTAKVADHTGPLLQSYKVYVNASSSDVVCTATAEALAMGKTVVLLDHPSNAFFAAFPNCYTFSTPEEFSAAFSLALSREPASLSDAESHNLTWVAATERFYDAVRMPPSKGRRSQVDLALANTHATLSKLVSQPAAGIRRAKSRDQLDDSSVERVSDDGHRKSRSRGVGDVPDTPRSALLSRLTMSGRKREASEPPLSRTAKTFPALS